MLPNANLVTVINHAVQIKNLERRKFLFSSGFFQVCLYTSLRKFVIQFDRFTDRFLQRFRDHLSMWKCNKNCIICSSQVGFLAVRFRLQTRAGV